MSAQPVRILLIEDNPVDAYLVKVFLAQGWSVPVALACAKRLSAALRKLERQAFDVILLDLNLPDSAGLDTFSSVHARAGTTPIVVLTGLNEEADAFAAMRMGAQDYLIKGKTDSHMLVRSLQFAIERVARLEQHRAERTAITRQLDQINDHFAKLSPRERQILELIAAGKTIKNIAMASGTSYHTVKNQRASILAKLKAQSDADLVRMVMVVRFGNAPAIAGQSGPRAYTADGKPAGNAAVSP
jgi:DNA-binding NarL/FixJ family response regulator